MIPSLRCILIATLLLLSCLGAPAVLALDNVVLTANAGANRTTEGLKPVVLDGGASTVTKGTASGWMVNQAGGYPATSTAIALSGGTGSFLIGDTVRFTGDNADYAVSHWDGSTLTITSGLVKAVANGVTISVSTDLVAWKWTRVDTNAPLGNGKALAVSLRGSEGLWGEANGNYSVRLTVTDSAGHTATSTMTITVASGTAPVADAGVAYEGGAGGPPVFFNGGNSTDDYGIIDYIWNTQVDAQSGAPLAGNALLYGRTPMYTYASAGTYYASLTVRDGRGNINASPAIVAVVIKANLPPQVSTIPFKGNPNLAHPAISGLATQLRGVARDAGALTYRWSFGDGVYDPVLGNAPAAVVNARAIEANHVYSGDPGKPYVATLTIYDSDGRASFATSKVTIEVDTPQIRADIAKDKALWYLHKTQTQSPLGQWTTYDNSYPSATASALQAFCINGSRPGGDPRTNPYCQTVKDGFDYLLTSCIQQNDTLGLNTPNGDAWSGGLSSLSAVGYNHPVYETGMIIDALASTESPLGLVSADSVANGRRYVDVVKDIVNMYVWGQSPGGGWYYSWNAGSNDNSASQWAAIGMKAAEDVFGISAPTYTKTRNQGWMVDSFNPNYSGYATFGYTDSNLPIWVLGANTAPSALVQMAWNGTPSSDYRWQAVEGSMKSWFTDGNSGYSNRNFYGLYAVAKSMHLAQPKRIDLLAGSFDWFGDAANGLRTRLLNWQAGDGSWTGYCDGTNGINLGGMATSWGVIMLSPNLFVQAPVAIQDTPPAWGYGVELQCDASRSFHIDPNKNIVKYEWDLDGDGAYEITSVQPRSALARKTYADPNPNQSGDQPQTFTLRLRVTDEFGQSDISTQALIVSEPPHAPFAEPGGPYLAMEGFLVTLNASDSFDIDPTDFVTSYGWDWNNSGVINNGDWTISPTVSHTFSAPGEYVVGLKVKDNGVFNGSVPLTSLFGYATVTVMPNQPPYAVITNAGSLNVAEGSTITLSGGSSSDADPGQSIVSWEWDLNYNGTTFNVTHSGQSVSKAWTSDGGKLIALRVSDGAKTTITATTVQVSDAAPTARFAWSPFSPYRNQAVQFTDTSTTPADPITGWSWDFGDGSALSTAQNPSHAYANVGSYTVTLTAADNSPTPSTNTTTRTITVGSEAVLMSKTNCSVTEGGATDQYTITLSSTPAQPMTMTLALPNRVQLVSGSNIHIFTDTTPWTVSVMALDDNIRQANNPEQQIITHSTTCSDPSWNALPLSPVQVQVYDNDFPNIQVEGGGQIISNGDTSPTTADGTDIPTQRVGSPTVDKIFTIRNAGSVPLNLTSLILSGDGVEAFTLTQNPAASVAANSTTTFTVRFTVPTTVASKNALVTIASDAPGALASYIFALHGATGVPVIALSGNSVPIANADATPAPADGTAYSSAVVGGAALTHTFAITNAGGYALTLTGTPAVVLGGDNAGDFTVVAQPSLTIGGGGNVTFQIRFAPTAIGLRNATITITSDDAGTPSYVFAIGGTGTKPVVVVSGNALDIAHGDTSPAVADRTDFGNVNVVVGRSQQTFTIRNAGVGDLDLNDPSVTFSGPAGAEFALATHPQGTLAPGASTTVTVAFDPVAAGLRTAILTLHSDDPITPLYTFTVAGTGVVLPTPVLTVTGNGVEVIGGADPMGGNYTYLGYTATGGGNTSPGTVSRIFTINNSGDADMQVLNIVLSGADVGDFSINLGGTQLPTTLIPGASFTFTVSMTPSASGARNATVTVTTAPDNTFAFPVRGYGLGANVTAPVINVAGLGNRDIPDATLIPSLDAGTDFGVTGPAVITRTFTIQNLGNATLNLNAVPIVVSGTGAAGFTVTQPALTTLNAGLSTTFSLTFDPPTLGTWQATITVTSTGNLNASLDQYTFVISGRRAFAFQADGQPVDAFDVLEDDTATFTVGVDAVDPVSYQWFVGVYPPGSEVPNWTAITDATGTALPIIASPANDGTLYRCQVSTASTWAWSNTAQLTVMAIPIAITGNPVAVTTVLGQPASFTVAATGKAPLTYQWQKSPLGSQVFTNISSTNNSTCTIPVTVLTDRASSFRCVVTAGNGLTATSAGALLTLTIPPPAITLISGDATLFEGYDAAFTITATGTQLTYQWQSQPAFATGPMWSDISNATAAAYTVTAATLAQNGLQFRCVVSDVDAVTATSATMTLQVNPIVAPTWSSSPGLLAVVGVPWEYRAVTSGGSGPIAPVLTGSTLPAWLSANGVSNGRWLLSGRPTAAGDHLVSLRVSNGGASANTQSFTLTAVTVPAVVVASPEVVLGPATGPAPYAALCLSTDEGVAAWRAALSGKDATQARGFAWDATRQAYVEFPAEPGGGLTPYHAVFLATRLDLGLHFDGLPHPMPAGLTLKPGWNFLGMPPLHDGTTAQTSHPWNYFTLQAEDATTLNSADFIDRLGTPGSGDRASSRPWRWNGSAYEQVDTLTSGAGYWFKNNGVSDMRLVRGLAPVPAPAFSASLLTISNNPARAALIDRGQPPAPPGGASDEGSAAQPGLEPDIGGGCGLGSANSGLFMLLLLLARLTLRRGPR